MLERIRHRFNALNLFESGLNDEQIVRRERYSTRLYLLLLIISFVILVVYVAFGVHTVHVTVDNPSLITYETLQIQFSETLKCPCTQIAVKYGSFVQIEPIYHQICESSFVSDAWIKASFQANMSNLWPMDVRTMMSAHAQFLRAVCVNSRRGIGFVRIESLSSSLVSAHVLPLSLVQLQVQIAEQNLRSAGQWQLLVLISFLRLITASSRFITGLGGNSFLYIPSNDSTTASIGINAYQLDSQSAPCYCVSINNCPMPGAIYLTNQFPSFGYYNVEMLKNYSIPIKGIQMGCFAMESALSSTLECYYDANCIRLLVSNPQVFPPLISSSNSTFAQNDTMEKLVNQLLVEQWQTKMSYDSYYEQCAPKICTYSFNQPNDFIMILTTIIGLIGGLNTVLRFLVPRLVTFLHELLQKCRPTSTHVERVAVVWIEQRPTLVRLKNKWVFLWSSLKMLNLFDSNSNSSIKQRRERHATRLYIVFLTLAFFVLFLYTISTEETEVFTIQNPTQKQYEELYADFGATIDCSCQTIGIPYSQFLNITARYHQICFSPFIYPDFITQLAMIRQDSPFHPGDFMLMSVNYFQWLTAFCALSQLVFPNQLVAFQNRLFVNNKLLPAEAFQVQAEKLVDFFIKDLQYYFARGIKQTREMIAFSQPLSATTTITYNLPIRQTPLGSQVIVEPTNFFPNCSCVYNPTECSSDAAFYSYDPLNNQFNLSYQVTGVRIACSAMDSLLQSTLTCWYSSNCYSNVLNYWRNRTYSMAIIPPLLTGANSSRYSLSTPVHTMVEQLMVEDWSKNVSFDSYYAACNPQFCTYSTTKRRAIIFIVTILLSLFGGLNVGLKLFTPFFIRMINWFKSYGEHSAQNFTHLVREIPNHFIRLNLFYHRFKSSPLTLRNERYSTRLYLVLIIVGVWVLLFYYALIESTTTITISNPNEKSFEILQKSKDVSSLQCPCKHVSINYHQFVQVNTTIHEVCSSSFTSLTWIKSVFGDANLANSSMNSFQGRGALHFQGLRSVCLLYQENITLYAEHFLSSALISDSVLSKDQLLKQVNDKIDQVKASSRADQSSMYKFARDLEQSNQMLTIFSTNWIYSPIRFDPNRIGLPIPLEPVKRNNCSCATTTECFEPVVHRDQIVPGLYVGCLPIQTLFRSSLDCLYNQTCVDQININHLPVQPLIMPKNPSLSINRTIEQLVDNALDLDWSVVIDYSKFYTECQPASCSYSKTHRKDVVQIIIGLLGLYGGLTVSLRVLVPYIIAITLKFFLRIQPNQNQVIPMN